MYFEGDGLCAIASGINSLTNTFTETFYEYNWLCDITNGNQITQYDSLGGQVPYWCPNFVGYPSCCFANPSISAVNNCPLGELIICHVVIRLF